MATPSSIRRIATAPSLRCQCLHDTALRATITTSSHTPSSSTSHDRTRPPSRRHFSSGAYVSPERSDSSSPPSLPRWKQTPRGMSMPFRVRPSDKKNVWRCNEDPKRLNGFYRRMLGAGGGEMLTEETKWLAVTHKSFDQGRRGFNDRLGYFGKRIMDMHTSQALLLQPLSPVPEGQSTPDEFGRYPFEHPLLEGLPNLSERQKAAVLAKNRLAQLGKEYGLLQVLRWQPRMVEDLSGSGVDLVMAHAMYAIVGAVALEKGSVVAGRIVKEKILRPLGLEVPSES